MKKFILSLIVSFTTLAGFAQCNLFLQHTNVNCNLQCNGTATANAFGGTAPYTFQWAPTGQTTSSISGLCAGTYTCAMTDAVGCTKTSTVTVTQPAALGVTATTTAANACNPCNGTATGTPAGGTAPYTYLWSSGATKPTATGLCAGNYTLTVTDSHTCVATTTVAVSGTSGISVSVSATNVTCNGACNGTAAANASGGTTPYTYLWSSGGATTSAVTGLCNGTYTVTVSDAGGCFSSKIFTITQPSVLGTTGTNHTNASCNGSCDGTAITNGNGGTPPYTYSWVPSGGNTNSVSGLCAGNYSCVITDANTCTFTRTLTITQPTAITVTTTSSGAISCSPCNGTANAIPSGGTGAYTYSWSPGGGNGSTASGLCAGNYTVTVKDANNCSAISTVSVSGSAGPAASISSSTNVLCKGSCTGAATATATGGATPYTFAWSDGQSAATATGLCAGSYTATVTDAGGCFSSAVVNITQPSTSVTITSTQLNVSCNGNCDGKATAAGSGGVPPYTYSWSNAATTTAITGLCAGNYTVTVTDANGCSVVKTYTVTQPSNIAIAVSSNNATSCAPCDGSASAAVVGGTAPYTYAWSPSGGNSSAATGLCAGNYTITVKDKNNCSGTSTVSITGPVPPSASIVSSTNASCNGNCDGSVTATASGGTGPYTYAWSPSGGSTASATGLCSGNYTVMVTDAGGCSAMTTNTITQPSVLGTFGSAHTNVSCNGSCNGTANTNGNGGTPPYTYSWVPSGGNTNAATGLCAGNYSCVITDANACTFTRTFTITQPSSIAIAASSTAAGSCSPCDGTASANTIGGTGAYTYSWSPSGGNSSAAAGLCAGDYTVTVMDANSCIATQTVNVGGTPGPVATVSSTSITCNGSCNGSATASGSGGTAPYTFAWSDGQSTAMATALCAGNYTVTISDAGGCFSTSIVTISQPAALTGTTSQINASCNNTCDGKASVSPMGGMAPYSYMWSNGKTTGIITGLCAGNYSVVVTDANGCTLTKSYTINQPGSIAISFTSNASTSCMPCNGNAHANAVGGTAPYNYAWSNAQTGQNANGLCAGNYTATVTDNNGCTTSNTISITGPTGPSLTTTTTASGCSTSTGTATANATGGSSPYTYMWMPGGQTTQTATGLAAGNYTATVTDANGCSSSIAANVSAGGLSVSVSSAGNSATATPNGGTPNYIYTWSDGQSTQTATGLANGTYTVCVTDANSCTACNTVVINVTAVSNLAVNTEVRVYPNPTSEFVFVEAAYSSAQTINISILNILGETLSTEQFNSGIYMNKKLYVGNLKQGIYLLRVVSSSGIIVKKLTIQ